MTTRPLSALAFQYLVARLEDELDAALGSLRIDQRLDISDSAALARLRERLSSARQHARMLRDTAHALRIEPELTYE